MPLHHWQTHGIINLTRKPLVLLDHLNYKKVSRLTLPWQLCAISVLPSVPKSRVRHIPQLSVLRELQGTASSFLDQPKCPQPFMARHAVQSCYQLWCLLRMLSTISTSVFKVRVHQHWIQKDNHLLITDYVVFDVPQNTVCPLHHIFKRKYGFCIFL